MNELLQSFPVHLGFRVHVQDTCLAYLESYTKTIIQKTVGLFIDSPTEMASAQEGLVPQSKTGMYNSRRGDG